MTVTQQTTRSGRVVRSPVKNELKTLCLGSISNMASPMKKIDNAPRKTIKNDSPTKRKRPAPKTQNSPWKNVHYQMEAEKIPEFTINRGQRDIHEEKTYSIFMNSNYEDIVGGDSGPSTFVVDQEGDLDNDLIALYRIGNDVTPQVDSPYERCGTTGPSLTIEDADGVVLVDFGCEASER